MFPSRHQALVDHLRRIVSSSVDVDALLDHRVTARTQGLASLVSARLYLRLRAVRRCRHVEIDCFRSSQKSGRGAAEEGEGGSGKDGERVVGLSWPV